MSYVGAVGTGLGVFRNYDAASNVEGLAHEGLPYAVSGAAEQQPPSLIRRASNFASNYRPGRRYSNTDAPRRSSLTQEVEEKEEAESPYQEEESSDPEKDQNELRRKTTREERIEEARRNRAVAQLARQMTQSGELQRPASLELSKRQSVASGVYQQNPFEPEPDSVLDPHSANFRPRTWAKALLNLASRDPDNYMMRTAGFSFKNLNVHGFGSATDYQKTVGNSFLQAAGLVRGLMKTGQRKIDILQGLDGLVYAGEMLVVLGPPGSGCTTFLKTVSGETHGFFVDENSAINYQGIHPKQMHHDFRGEAIYTAEVDVHFPSLTVGETLQFAAQARAPRIIPNGIGRKTYAKYMRDIVMAMFGISHTINTKVGNDYVRGVSGGERKRVTIAEALLAGAPLQCWDNSTRGLDSANAIEFCKTLRIGADVAGTTAAVAIYQAPQSAYDLFDKVLVLYEGRQIYFGHATSARGYFERLGYHCPDRQTTADFLTSMTSPIERVVRKGFEGKVPNTPDDFAKAWKSSKDHADLMVEIEKYEEEHPYGGQSVEDFKTSRRMQQSKHQRPSSPYTLSYGGQIGLCLQRGFQRLKADPSLTLTQLLGNSIMALIVGSVFYNLDQTTGSFYSRSALLFFAILLNAFSSALEILTLYAQRPIVEKHTRYAFYQPSAEAMASMLTDMPYKIANAICFNIILYFMTDLRRTPGAFFFFCLISFSLTLAMSMMFRTIASVSRTLAQALAPSALLILAIVIYTGFALPIPYMRGWARWINYLDVVGYAFESLMINEFNNRNFTCSSLVPSGPGYTDAGSTNQVCSVVGSTLGSLQVDGSDYIASSYQYVHSHKWRNFGIIIAFIIGFGTMYVTATEFISAKKSKGEVLVFRRGHTPATLKNNAPNDVETAGGRAGSVEKSGSVDASTVIERQTAIFQWKDVCYDIKIKGEDRRILDHVDGWVKPGTLTALMGVSGAGKTTLLDVLATRTTMGVISGEMLVDGRQRDASFQRKTGYVQQQDLHLETTTVREALNFSALLRQPAHVPKSEKLAYVDEVIKLLDMEEYADAVVGVPGEGLNVEQRKRLTIGVELAAKPQLLLFLDEPTSGLDSQTSWAICDLMEKLTKSGQAILCTIHQPSAMLFQRFDRLLFLAKGGRTVYFGEVGQNSSILTEYFQKNGAHPCPPDANPAEWMLEVIGAAPGSHSDIDWHQTWLDSPQRAAVRDELENLKENRLQQVKSVGASDKASYKEFAAPFTAQIWEVQHRVFQQYWRTPSYIYSKLALVTGSSIFIGFSFYNAGTSQQALQNQMFSIFMLLTIFGQLTQQIMPLFVTQRALYEVRERPSKTYSWKAFMISNIFVELPWNFFAGVIIFFCWYYPIGLYKNAVPTNAVHERGALMFLLVESFMLFASTFATMMIAAIDTAETASNIGNLLFSLCLIFNGVLAAPGSFPQFWIFMYRVSPFTYLVNAMLSTGLANTDVVCASNEYLRFYAPSGETCGDYMSTWIDSYGGYLTSPNATGLCEFCSIKSTNVFLAEVSSTYSTRWRNFGILWAFICFNIAAAVFLYWLARVPKSKGKRAKKE